MSFWDLLRPPTPVKIKGTLAAPPAATAAALREALTEAESEAATAEQTAADLALARADQLLVGTEAELDEADRRLQLAQRSADRAAVAVEALRTKLTEAEGRERQADLDRVFAAGQSALDRGLAIYKTYHQTAAELAAMLSELPGISGEIATANRQLGERDDPRRVADLDTTARPETSDLRELRTPLWEAVRLPAGDHPHHRLHPPHRHLDIRWAPRAPAQDGAEPAPPPRDTSVVA